MEVAEITSIIAVAVAVISFLFSMYNLYVHRMDERPRLKVDISNGKLIGSSVPDDVMLFFEVANPGKKQITVHGVSIIYKKLKFVVPLMQGTATLPFELAPGKKHTLWTPLEEFTKGLKKWDIDGTIRVRARAVDAIGNEFYSKRFKVNIDA